MNDYFQVKEIIENKKVLFIATKNKDYIRIKQECVLLRKYTKKLDVIVSSYKNYFNRLLYVYFKVLISNVGQYDIIFLGFAPQLILPFFRWKFKNKLIMADFFISLYDTFVFDRKKVKEKSLIAKVLKGLDIFTLNFSDVIICDTKAHSEYFIKELGADPSKVKVLYLEADKDYYFPKKVGKPKHLIDKYIVLYFGSNLPLQGVDVILKATEMIDEDDIHFIIIGPMKKEINPSKFKNVTFIGWLSQQELSNYIAFSDLCLAGHFNSSVNKAKRTIPGKAYIYEAMNKKMILGDNSANKERYPRLYQQVIFVEMGNPKDLAKKIVYEYSKKNKK